MQNKKSCLMRGQDSLHNKTAQRIIRSPKFLMNDLSGISVPGLKTVLHAFNYTQTGRILSICAACFNLFYFPFLKHFVMIVYNLKITLRKQPPSVVQWDLYHY